MKFSDMHNGMYLVYHWTKGRIPKANPGIVVKADINVSLIACAGIDPDGTRSYIIAHIPNRSLWFHDWSGDSVSHHGKPAPNYEDKCKELATKWLLSGGKVTRLEAD